MKRYYGLDLFRAICVIATCAFHTTIHLGADYGILQNVSRMGAVFMTAFFMLSGCCLYLNYGAKNLVELVDLKLFYLKRIIAIVPVYYIVSCLYVLTPPHVSIEHLIENLWLLPIELLGLQSNFSTLFPYTHNGGTWFISCILMCYLIYPFVQLIAKQLSSKQKITIVLICSFILIYSPFIVTRFKTVTIYANTFFRCLEFVIGVMIASLKPNLDQMKLFNGAKKQFMIMSLGYSIMFILVSIAVSKQFAVGDYMKYSLFCLPCFIMILIASMQLDVAWSKIPIFDYFIQISFCFFMAQFFSNKISKYFIEQYDLQANYQIIALGWIFCFAITIPLYELAHKPITRFLKKKYL